MLMMQVAVTSKWRAVTVLSLKWLAYKRTCVDCASGAASSPSCWVLCWSSFSAVPLSPSLTMNNHSQSRSTYTSMLPLFYVVRWCSVKLHDQTKLNVRVVFNIMLENCNTNCYMDDRSRLSAIITYDDRNSHFRSLILRYTDTLSKDGVASNRRRAATKTWKTL